MSWETGVLYWLCLMSFVSFAAMGLDKRSARRGARRTPEKRLFLFAALGGAVGGLLGMYLFRHKTRHWYFVVGFWALFALQGAALYWFLFRI
jgi:Predicted membrane protein